MIKLASLILLCIGIALVFLSVLFAGGILIGQYTNEFYREDRIRTLVDSENFKQETLEQKVVDLAIENVQMERIRDAIQVRQSIFYLCLSVGVLILSSGLTLFIFWQNRRFNEQLKNLAIASL